MLPFALNHEVIIGHHPLSPFHMEPGKVYYTCAAGNDMSDFLLSHGKSTHNIGLAMLDMDALSWFEKRKQVREVLRERGDADYFIQYFYFLPAITPNFVRFYDYTASRMFGFEYYFNQFDVIILSLYGHDEKGKSSIFRYLRNRELAGKIVIVLDPQQSSQLNFGEWHEDHFDQFLHECKPMYPHDNAATDHLYEYL